MLYEDFEDGWKLDPWLHGNGRPWTQYINPSPCSEGATVSAQVWNLVLFEPGDLPEQELSAFQAFIAGASPVVNLPTLKLEAPPIEDPIIAEELVAHGETAKFVALGYEAPEKEVWAKNRLVRLRASVATDIMDGGLSEVAVQLLDAMDNDLIVKYLRDVGKLKDAIPVE